MRFSIGKLMILVAVASINLYLIDSVVRPRGDRWLNGHLLHLIILGVLPMADILTIASFFRTEGRAAIDRFLLAGGLAMLLLLWTFALSPRSMAAFETELMDGLLGPDHPAWTWEIVWVAVAVLLNLAPQLAIAILASRIRPRGDVAPAHRPGV